MKRSSLFYFICLFCFKSYAQFDLQHLLVQIDSPWTYQHFQLIPIRFKMQPTLLNEQSNKSLVPISLERAMAEKKILIKEINYMGGADVNVLVIKNISNQPIIINSGDLLSGGKQDRVVAETKLLMPGKEEDYLSVFCTEKNRWSKKSQPFEYGGKADIELRTKVDIVKKQPDIWKEINRQLNTVNIKSATEQYAALQRKLNNADSIYFKYFMNRFATSDSAYAGFIAITGNTIIGTEVFVAPQLLQASYPAILQSFLSNKPINSRTPSVDKIILNAYIESLLGAANKQAAFLQTHGAIYRYNGMPIHLIAFGN